MSLAMAQLWVMLLMATSRQEEIGIGTRADERIVHGVMKSHQIQKRRDEPRSKLF